MHEYHVILVMSFEPYDGSSLNPAELVLNELPDHINSVNLRKVVLACDSLQTPLRALELASDPLISTVVIIGEDGRYALPTLERIAYNWLQYNVPDNLGRQPINMSIEPQGPASLPSPLDVEAIRLALVKKGTLINISDDPGRHLCNHVYYTVLYNTNHKPVLLLHLPRLPMQQPHPSMALADSLHTTLDVLTLFSFLIDRRKSVGKN